MNTRAYLHGYEIYCDDKSQWFYVDSGEPANDVPEELKKRPCPSCKEVMPESGQDACIQNLPNTKYACCGHGLKAGDIGFEQAYIMLDDDTVYRFNTTEEFYKWLEDNLNYKANNKHI